MDARILIVDDQESNVLLLKRLLEHEGYKHIAATMCSGEVVELFERSPPDLLLLDLQMPEPDGFAVMEQVRPWTARESYIPILVLTADASVQARRQALAAGARDFLTKPLDAAEVSLRIHNLLQVRQLQLELQAQNVLLEHRVRHRTWELERSRTEAFHKLALAAEYRDDETHQHTQRVGRIAAVLAAQLGFDAGLVRVIGEVAPLHDLGKIGIPDSILLKPGSLTDAEFTTMRTHAQIGADIMAGTSSPLFEVAADIALTHHERWDGSGYPRGLAGEAIPLAGRIVALADAFDAMSHERPYRAAAPLDEVMAEIDRCAGTQFDPAVVEAFHRLDRATLLSPARRAPTPSITPPGWEALREIDERTGHRSTAAMDALLEASFDNTPVAALIADDQRRCVAANATACRMLDISRDELRLLRIDDFAAPEARAHLDATWAEFLRAGVQKADFELISADGRPLEISYRAIAHLLPGRHLSLLEPRRHADRTLG